MSLYQMIKTKAIVGTNGRIEDWESEARELINDLINDSNWTNGKFRGFIDKTMFNHIDEKTFNKLLQEHAKTDEEDEETLLRIVQMKSRMRDEEMRRRMRDEAKQAAPQKIRVNFDDDEDENTGTHATRGSGRNTENPNYATRGTYKKKSPSNTLYQIIKNQKGTQHWAERGFKTYRDYESDAKELIKENYPRWINKDYKGFYNASIFDNISEEKFNKLWFEEKVRQIRSRQMLRKFIKRSRSKKNKVQVGQVKTMDDIIREKFAQAKANNLLIEIDDSPKSIKAAPKKIITNVDDSDDSDHEEPKKSSNKKKSPPKKVKKRVTFSYQPDMVKFYDPNSDGTKPRSMRSK